MPELSEQEILEKLKGFDTPSITNVVATYPNSCIPLSVSPLSCSHAATVIVVYEYIDKFHELQAQLQHKERATWSRYFGL